MIAVSQLQAKHGMARCFVPFIESIASDPFRLQEKRLEDLLKAVKAKSAHEAGTVNQFNKI